MKTERCENCRYSKLTKFLGYLICRRKDEVVYHSDKACDEFEEKEKSNDKLRMDKIIKC